MKSNHKRNTSGLILWKKGQSGNPAGRPKGAKDFAVRCRAWADQYGVPFLMELLEKPETDERLKCQIAEYLIDRGYGKAPQSVEVHGNITLENLIVGNLPKEGE